MVRHFAACDDAGMQTDPHEELSAAIAAERAAWSRVKDQLPGTPDYNEALWHAWQGTVQRCRDARQAVDGAARTGQLSEGQRRDPGH
jgi:hypothetical protein